ncbi:hypothetical protein HKX48_003340 [Thoreauomyces humboldtii]|nr:hypothetical protein HKX48_003340 [Thoreauomyces humboldtii]
MNTPGKGSFSGWPAAHGVGGNSSFQPGSARRRSGGVPKQRLNLNFCVTLSAEFDPITYTPRDKLILKSQFLDAVSNPEGTTVKQLKKQALATWKRVELSEHHRDVDPTQVRSLIFRNSDNSTVPEHLTVADAFDEREVVHVVAVVDDDPQYVQTTDSPASRTPGSALAVRSKRRRSEGALVDTLDSPSAGVEAEALRRKRRRSDWLPRASTNRLASPALTGRTGSPAHPSALAAIITQMSKGLNAVSKQLVSHLRSPEDELATNDSESDAVDIEKEQDAVMDEDNLTESSLDDTQDDAPNASTVVDDQLVGKTEVTVKETAEMPLDSSIDVSCAPSDAESQIDDAVESGSEQDHDVDNNSADEASSEISGSEDQFEFRSVHDEESEVDESEPDEAGQVEKESEDSESDHDVTSEPGKSEPSMIHADVVVSTPTGSAKPKSLAALAAELRLQAAANGGQISSAQPVEPSASLKADISELKESDSDSNAEVDQDRYHAVRKDGTSADSKEDQPKIVDLLEEPSSILEAEEDDFEEDEDATQLGEVEMLDALSEASKDEGAIRGDMDVDPPNARGLVSPPTSPDDSDAKSRCPPGQLVPLRDSLDDRAIEASESESSDGEADPSASQLLSTLYSQPLSPNVFAPKVLPTRPQSKQHQDFFSEVSQAKRTLLPGARKTFIAPVPAGPRRVQSLTELANHTHFHVPTPSLLGWSQRAAPSDEEPDESDDDNADQDDESNSSSEDSEDEEAQKTKLTQPAIRLAGQRKKKKKKKKNPFSELASDGKLPLRVCTD